MKKVILLAIIALAFSFVSCEQNGQHVSEVEDATSRKVETENVYDLTATTAIIIGSINIDISEYHDVAFGVMYSDNKEELSARKGNRNEAPYLNGKEFEVEIKGLKPQTMYYYCAWLFLNGKQYEYGDIKQFETLEGNIYAIGEFSVSSTKKVAFSSGNLQYQVSRNTWCFAENQWDYIGRANSNNGSSDSDWIDLFAWGTGNNPTEYNYNNGFTDWGNNINNATNTWRTLTGSEWKYLLESRLNSHNLCSTATINKVPGLIILPDDWNDPNLSLISGVKGWENNVYSVAEWKELEYKGAVFLPAAGKSWIIDIGVKNYGCYWSSSEFNSNFAYCLYLRSDEACLDLDYRYNVHSVRLVKDLQ